MFLEPNQSGLPLEIDNLNPFYEEIFTSDHHLFGLQS